MRIALGASAAQLVSFVMSESFRLTGVGLVIGFALSIVVAAVLARFLYGLTPTDPATFASVFALLAGASLRASYLPARRAANTDPAAQWSAQPIQMHAVSHRRRDGARSRGARATRMCGSLRENVV